MSKMSQLHAELQERGLIDENNEPNFDVYYLDDEERQRWEWIEKEAIFLESHSKQEL